jgi:hypothetical protein
MQLYAIERSVRGCPAEEGRGRPAGARQAVGQAPRRRLQSLGWADPLS